MYKEYSRCMYLLLMYKEYNIICMHLLSNGDSLDALKRCLDPEMANNGLIWAKKGKI